MKTMINLEDLFSKDPKIKYGCARNLSAIAKDNPKRIYSHIDFFEKLMDNENNILKWIAIDIIGFLSKIDKEKKIDKQMDKLFSLLNVGKMITANHAITALGNIALTKPEYQEKITEALLKVEQYKYDTDECRNIAIGNVILVIGSYFGSLENIKTKKAVIEFIEKQNKNTRNATKNKAEKFLRKFSKS
jgi:hypothetical protein